MNRKPEPRPRGSSRVSRRRLLGTLGAVGLTGAFAGCSSGGRDAARGTDTRAGTPSGSGGPGGDRGPTNYFEQGPTVGVEPVATGLVSPNALVAADGRRFVLDQVGQVYVLGDDGVESTFLDLSDRLVALGQDLPNWIAYDERGLLGLAFHPDFATNRKLYVRYSTPAEDPELDHREILSEFTATADRDGVDTSSERVLLDMPWPRPIHQSGTIEFGPDGYLYGALGDGLNPFNGQDLDNLKGCIVRIDVDGRTGDLPYGIPGDNPLVGVQGRDELYAWGLRNPWKMAFSGDRLILGDVGQATWEEVNVVEKGGNYGWPLKEGFHCHDPQLGTSAEGECVVESARGEPLVDPKLEFPHFDEAGDAVGFAVIGGHVHTGDIDPLRDDYLFGVFTSSFTSPAGRLVAATPRDSGRWPTREVRVEGGLDIQVLSLGQADGDSYVLGTRAALAEDPLTRQEGVVYRLTS
ncbi:PQQ-dependent sugar dehydrogenase [Haloarcula onubensis]|uniref:PQQ-dependent sugar dehydrogenase n=1 Tax=Haloarcula onubensis TaxID=2950539 RepID=A0ABU2FVR8_9EURY|nr:PQQ-dependent sugar dehydrogenase [Halomicroarcula sp. S3CR25-11]MDS0284539.1 PQQ-dependent sugar dehydrogenase [Halomicroarcula sp. S3CR25-11]